ncbi:MAG: MBL fold metallo-hydrolase [Candidatus Solibacter usitatus]|nr:MBL fold metallo-hydrolase [Candidatus Solibacter usitatus]
MLVDTGWAGFNYRDADRIATAAKKSGVTKINWLVITHFHADHVGGIKQLAERLPILNVVDHGKTVETAANNIAFFKTYEEVAAKSKRHTVKPGDKIPVKGLNVEVLSAHGATSGRKGKANALCGGVKQRENDLTDNGQSVGTLISFGKFRFLDLGDLTWNKELALACPDNRIGKVDLYLTTHHGADSPAALIHAIGPRVAIMNNGEKKGGAAVGWKTVKASPGLKDLWQLHFAAANGKDANVEEQLIANPQGKDEGNYLMVQAGSDGKFSVTNSRNGLKRSY